MGRNRHDSFSGDGGPATFSADGKRLVIVARNGLVLWSLANGTSKTVSTGKGLPDRGDAAGVAAELKRSPMRRGDVTARQTVHLPGPLR